MSPVLTDSQAAEMRRVQAYFPYRIVYGAVSPAGEFECAAVATMREPNKLVRAGWTVFTCNRGSK